MTDRFYEDFKVGDRFMSGGMTMTEDAIIGFARQWDPQPFHLDEEAAQNSVLGGLAASGWQSSAILIKLSVEGYANRSAAMASNSMEEGRWLKPVYAGETLTGRATARDADRAKNAKKKS